MKKNYTMSLPWQVKWGKKEDRFASKKAAASFVGRLKTTKMIKMRKLKK